jgi:SAM-dependent methyltransferase
LGEAGQDQESFAMWSWYRKYYQATADSRANATFCERLYGRNLGQHGFADMAQLERLLELTVPGPGQRVLDLGCGQGAMAEYISDRTGAHVTGIDYIPEAICQALERIEGKRHRLDFQVGDMARIHLPPGSFDLILSIDTLYFTGLRETVGQLKDLLKPGGQMGILYSHGADPSTPIAVFRRETLPPERTPLGEALRYHGLPFRTWDLTADDYRHAQRKKRIAEELRAEFEAEGHLFLYENRHGEAEGVMAAIEAGAHARYLYHVQTVRCQ